MFARAVVIAVLATACAGQTSQVRTRPKLKTVSEQLFEKDALLFVWGSAVAATTSYIASEPDGLPRGFPPSEGGAPAASVAVPNWQIALGATMAPVLVASSSSEARWYHAKGIAQSLLTTAAITDIAKNLFRRHRPCWPCWGDDTDHPDARKSFFSGHSSLTLAATTYGGLFLHHHVFAKLRGNARFAWWEVPPYISLAALSIYVPYTRWRDNMHHTSDLITGGIVGASLSTAFFVWQERSYRKDRTFKDLTIVPTFDTPGAAVAAAFD